MTPIVIHNGISRMSFEALGYEYTNEDWLMVRIGFDSGNGFCYYTDPCIEDYDLTRIVDWLDQILDGESDTPYIGMTEPYFYIECEKHKDMYSFAMNFEVWEGSHRVKTIVLKETMTRSRFIDIINAFEGFEQALSSQ